MDTVLLRKLEDWDKARQAAAAAKEVEYALRKQIMALAFPDGRIGVNTLDLANGWKLKGTYKVNYSFDEAALDPVLEVLRKKQINTDTLVRVRREPSMNGIKKLSEESRRLLDEALIAKPGMPELKLEPPKEPRE